MAKVELKKLFKTYNKKIKALEDINLTIEDGQFFVLLGPSGAGKTTTLRCIAGLEKIDSGDVLFNDENITHDQLEAMSLADRIAVMDGGEILQADEPNIIYNKPKTKFVASFIGSPGMNFFEVNEGISKDQSFVNIEGAKFDIPKQLSLIHISEPTRP